MSWSSVGCWNAGRIQTLEMGSGGSEQKARHLLLVYPALFYVRKDGSCYPTGIVLTDILSSFNVFGFLQSSSPEFSANS